MLVLDLTRPLDESTPVYGDSHGYADPPTRLSTWIDVDQIQQGSGRRSPFRVTRLEMSLHAGTHVDAPAHFASAGATLDALPASALVGRAVVVNLLAAGGEGQTGILARSRDVAMAPDTIPLLLMPEGGQLTREAVAEVSTWRRTLLCICGGIDGDDPDCPATASLLGAGICLAVDLAPMARQVRDGDLLVVSPLPLRGVEGAPARILAVKLTS